MPSTPKTPASVDLDQVAKLVDALEKDLADAKPDEADIRKLRREIEAIRSLLRSPAPKHSRVRDSLHSIRLAMEGEIWRDAPYLTEIGRILGMS
jgi:hypothetical protein